MIPTLRCCSLAVAVASVFLSVGCLTPREEAKLAAFPGNRVFDPQSVGELPEGKESYFGKVAQSSTQSVNLLVLAPDAMLKKRYHEQHDLTLVVVAGSAIVQVEETRYFVKPGEVVFLPRMTAYAVMPHETEKPFSALLIFSPPFEPADTMLED